MFGSMSLIYSTFAFTIALIFFVIKTTIDEKLSVAEMKLKDVEATSKDFDVKEQEIKENNHSREERMVKTMKLYEFTKELSEFLEENKIIGAFENALKRFIQCEDCYYLEVLTKDAESAEGEIVALVSGGTTYGYVFVHGIKEDDRPLFDILISQLISNIKRARLYKRVQELAITDSLTKTFTRIYTLSRFDEELRRSIELNLSLSFLMIDIDNFKALNDKYGHLAGDVVLRSVAEIIKMNSREIDLIGRFGGEEFMVVLPMTNKDGAILVAERIRKSVESGMIKAFDELLSVTLSIGLSNYPDDAKTTQDLIDRADWALYRSKRTGKNKISVFGRYA